MAHNLDIEISALRKGWGEWCEQYRVMDLQYSEAVLLLFRVHAASSDLGADEEGELDQAITAFLSGTLIKAGEGT